MSDKAQASLPESVELHGITIHKMDLMETAKAMKHMRDIPRLFAGLQIADEDNIMDIAMPLLIDFIPDALEVLAIASRTPLEELNKKLDIGQAVECFIAVFKVNDFLSVGERIGKALNTAVPQAAKPQPKK